MNVSAGLIAHMYGISSSTTSPHGHLRIGSLVAFQRGLKWAPGSFRPSWMKIDTISVRLREHYLLVSTT